VVHYRASASPRTTPEASVHHRPDLRQKPVAYISYLDAVRPSETKETISRKRLRGLSKVDTLNHERRPRLGHDPRTGRTWHGYERARLESFGKPTPFTDGQIAAIAHANDLVLVTPQRQELCAIQGPAGDELVKA
jgi:hypothetical protein